MTALDNASIAAMLAAQEADMDAQVVTAQGHTRGELRAAFDSVKSSIHWKAPIRSLCRISDMETVALAIEFFTGSKATFVDCPAAVREQGWTEVHADGYRVAMGE